MPAARPPTIPPSTNNSSNYTKTLQAATLRVQEDVSFFGSSLVGQQTVYPTIGSILVALQHLGLAAPGYNQEAGPLVGSDATGTVYQGCAVALSTDGSTLAVGGYYDNSQIGATWIFVKNNCLWTQQGLKLVGSDGGESGGSISQGFSVALSADGNTLAVGGYNDDFGVGATWVYTRADDTWTQQGSKLVGSDSEGNAEQGGSVSLSADGNTLAVGGNFDDSNIGATWIFTRTDETWTQQGLKLVGEGAVGNANQGISVSLSGDGNTLAVGGYEDDSGIGATWIFVRESGSWSQQGSKLVGTGGVGSSISQGGCVALRGNTLIVGGSGDDTGIGAAWVFKRTGTTWSQVGQKLVGTGYVGAEIEQGTSVSLSDDEQTFISGGYGDNDGIGAVWVFRLTNGVWTQYGPKLVPTGYTGTPTFSGESNSIAISGDSTTIAIGNIANDSSIGATWVYIGQ